MITGDEFRQWALALSGTSEAPHFDRTAFRVKRNFATMIPDSFSANLLLTPDEQQMQCTLYPEVFRPVDNKWGLRGWTTASLEKAEGPEIQAALKLAWQNGVK